MNERTCIYLQERKKEEKEKCVSQFRQANSMSDINASKVHTLRQARAIAEFFFFFGDDLEASR